MNCLSVFDHFVGLALKGLTHFFQHFLNILYRKKTSGLVTVSDHFVMPGKMVCSILKEFMHHKAIS